MMPHEFRLSRFHGGSVEPEEIDLAAEERRRRKLDDTDGVLWGERAEDHERTPFPTLDAVAVVIFAVMAGLGVGVAIVTLAGWR